MVNSPFNAVGILQFMEEGIYNVDRPIALILPELIEVLLHQHDRIMLLEQQASLDSHRCRCGRRGVTNGGD